MKKYFFLIVGLLLFTVGALFGQEVEPISDLSDWVGRFPELQSSLGGVIAQVLFLPPILIGFLNMEESKKLYKYLITGAIIAILTVLATVMAVGFLYGAPILLVILTFALLFAGQLIGYALVPGIFDLIASKFNPWKPAE